MGYSGSYRASAPLSNLEVKIRKTALPEKLGLKPRPFGKAPFDAAQGKQGKAYRTASTNLPRLVKKIGTKPVKSDDFHGRTIAPKLITLTLRRSRDSTPVQSWTFENQSIIKIGRATDNDVVLHSSVVSRYHLELQYSKTHWKLVSIGNNGTYLNGELIEQVPVMSGMLISLAQSGPALQIHVGETSHSLPAKAQSNQSRPPSQDSRWERRTFIHKPPDEFRDRNEP